MFDVSSATGLSELVGIDRYHGPDRRSRVPARLPRCLAATLDEIDYGMLLLGDDLRVIHANHAARGELDATHPLQLLGRTVCARRAQDMLPFVEALHAATKRGLRKLLTLGGDALRISVSVVPLSAPRDDGEPVALVVLGRRHVCGNLSIQSFANSHGLSPAEARVLTGLCGGSSPMKIASEVGVAISTVRSQIGSIRLKTGAQSIRGLVQLVATLPPLMEVLQRGGCGRSSSFDD